MSAYHEMDYRQGADQCLANALDWLRVTKPSLTARDCAAYEAGYMQAVADCQRLFAKHAGCKLDTKVRS